MRGSFHYWKVKDFLEHTNWSSHTFSVAIFFSQVGLLRHEFIPLWSCRVQHLTPFYCGVKPKQRGKAVISCDVWYLPLLVLSWMTVLTCFIIVCLHQKHFLETCEFMLLHACMCSCTGKIEGWMYQSVVWSSYGKLYSPWTNNSDF